MSKLQVENGGRAALTGSGRIRSAKTQERRDKFKNAINVHLYPIWRDGEGCDAAAKDRADHFIERFISAELNTATRYGRLVSCDGLLSEQLKTLYVALNSNDFNHSSVQAIVKSFVKEFQGYITEEGGKRDFSPPRQRGRRRPTLSVVPEEESTPPLTRQRSRSVGPSTREGRSEWNR